MKKNKAILVFAVLIISIMILYIISVDVIDTEFIETDKKTEYCIFIEVDDHKLYLLQNGECIRNYPIAAGKANTPSPLGYWKIIEKSTWGGSFGGRWMGLNVPWGKYGIHGTMKPGSIGWNASHGCIRMYNRDVQELYRMVSHGTPVVIVHGSFGPFGKGFRNLKPGDRGADVFAVQERLKKLGYYKGYVDGIYGDAMKSAVHKYQRDNKLYVSNVISRRMHAAMGFREFE